MYLTTEIHTELPLELGPQALAFLVLGRVGDFNQLLAEALRRHLESHASRLAESFIREDATWGWDVREVGVR